MEKTDEKISSTWTKQSNSRHYRIIAQDYVL